MGADDHAIVVGISRYPSFEELRGPENDAAAVVEWLEDPNGGDVPSDHIKRIGSDDFPGEARPTADDVYRKFDELIDLAEANDPRPAGRRLYIFMAGHGFGPALREAALLMANAAPRRSGYHIDGGAVADHFGQSAYFREIVLLMDCCRDDLGIAQFAALPWQPPPGGAPKVPVRWLYGFATGFSRKAREKPIDGDVRGVFTVAMLEGLRAGARTSTALKNFVTTRMSQLMDPDDQQRPYFQPSPYEIEFGIPVARPKLNVRLAPGAHEALVTIDRGEQAPPLRQRTLEVGEVWTVELDPGLYEVRRQDTSASEIVKLTTGEEDVEI